MRHRLGSSDASTIRLAFRTLDGRSKLKEVKPFCFVVDWREWNRSSMPETGEHQPNDLSTGSCRQDPHRVWNFTAQFCERLCPDDSDVQLMADVNPTHWHLAHTTWFFVTFVLVVNHSECQLFSDRFGYPFNSYFKSASQLFPVLRVVCFRDPRFVRFETIVVSSVCALRKCLTMTPVVFKIVELGIHHEQQVLMLLDIEQVFPAARCERLTVPHFGVWKPSSRSGR